MSIELRLNPAPSATTLPAVDASGRYAPVSYWQETVKIEARPALTSDTDCDVAIVGAGYTGLSTAIALKQAAPGLDVVVLERAVAGHGASGRNGGFAMPLIGWDLTDAAAKLGEPVAGEAYRLMYRAVAHLKKVVRETPIDCDMEETGYLLLATSKARVGRVKHEVELAQRLGFDWQYLEGDALRAHIGSSKFIAGAYDPLPAIINPAKLVRGLLNEAVRLGVRVYEQSPLDALTDGAPVLLRSGGATVRAKQVVLGVNGYGQALGFMPSRIQPVHTYIVLTEPLSDKDMEAIGWGKHRTSLETARNFIHYFRLTVDNRILFGGEDAWLFFGGKYYDVHPPTFKRLEARFREYFPQLSHVKISHQWGGVLGVTMDMFPTFGVVGAHKNIWHAAGYSGHGVALSNYAGAILAPKILRQTNITHFDLPEENPFFWNHRSLPIPPEPFRYLGLHVYRAALRFQDWWQRA